MKETKYLVKLVKDGKTYYSDWDSLSQAEIYCKGVEIGAECTIYSEVKKYNKYMTLREYIEENQNGEHHNFIFDIGRVHIRVINITEFERYYNKDLLDKFYVVADKEKSYGDNFENHNLTLNTIIEDKR